MKKKHFDYKTRVTNDLTVLMLNKDSIMFCDKCKERLGVLHTLRYALFKKQGTTYYVTCKICRFQNPRVKGQYKQDVTDKWKDMERDLEEKQCSTEKTKEE